jgi:hypothetical protein
MGNLLLKEADSSSQPDWIDGYKLVGRDYKVKVKKGTVEDDVVFLPGRRLVLDGDVSSESYQFCHNVLQCLCAHRFKPGRFRLLYVRAPHTEATAENAIGTYVWTTDLTVVGEATDADIAELLTFKGTFTTPRCPCPKPCSTATTYALKLRSGQLHQDDDDAEPAFVATTISDDGAVCVIREWLQNGVRGRGDGHLQLYEELVDGEEQYEQLGTNDGQVQAFVFWR